MPSQRFVSMWLLVTSSLVACEPTARSDRAPSGRAVPSATPLPSASATATPSVTSSAATRGATRSGCPGEMARVNDYCIDRYEAHLTFRDPDGRLRRHSPYERPEDGVAYYAESAAGEIPQAYVNRNEATAACTASKKRLCTLEEWYTACAGPERTTYPYGKKLVSGYCNSGKAHLLAKLFGRDPRRWSYKKHFNSPRLNREPGFLAKTGSYERCVSAVGVYDLVGNLHEWVSDRVDYSLKKKLQLHEDIEGSIPDNIGKGIFMGGFYSTTDQHGPGCRFLTPGHGPGYHDYTTGFRCCADASGGSDAK